MNSQLHSFFDKDSATFSYIVADPETSCCAIIDAVKDFDYISGRTDTSSADKIIETIEQNNYSISWILETHIHADHLSAANYIKEKLGGRIGIGENIKDVQKIFKKIFNAEDGFKPDGRQFDHLFSDNEAVLIGNMECRVLFTPGHTPACVTYEIDNMLFVGDTIFMPDVGTARADFPGGDAHQLFKSIKKILDYPPETKIMICHDYPPDCRDIRCETTVQEERNSNIHVQDGISEDEFVAIEENQGFNTGNAHADDSFSAN